MEIKNNENKELCAKCGGKCCKAECWGISKKVSLIRRKTMAHQTLNQDMKDLCDIIYDWMKSILYDTKDACGLWLDTITTDGFEWTLINDVEFQGQCAGLVPCEDDNKNLKGYNIYNYFCDPRYVNIVIRGDVVTWWEDSYTEYKDFTRTQMHSLYEKILEYYQNKDSKDESPINQFLKSIDSKPFAEMRDIKEGFFNKEENK